MESETTDISIYLKSARLGILRTIFIICGVLLVCIFFFFDVRIHSSVDYQENDFHENLNNLQNLPVITKFGTQSYQCTGSCYCDENEERRSGTLASSRMALKYLIASVSSISAFYMAKEHFRSKCEDSLSCEDNLFIVSEVDDCQKVEEETKEKEKEKSLDSNFDNTDSEEEEDPCQDIDMILGDILECEEDYLMHQCNCLTTTGGGLSHAVFEKYPECDIYKTRADTNPFRKDKPGTIEVKKPVINLLAQYYPTIPKKGKNSFDNAEQRLDWFEECLRKVEDYFGKEKVSIAVPFKIGCGLGGGDWNEYLRMLMNFNGRNDNIELCLYKLERVDLF